MALLIDINDLALRCYHEGKLLSETPGYALVDSKTLIIGEQAQSQARLNPLQLHNDFWQQLSSDALDSGALDPRQSRGNTLLNPRVRHNADLAHTQLQQLLQQLPSELQQTPLIFCLPSSWEKQQLSLFLGLAQTFNHPVIGLVDSAVAALANHPHSHQQLYIEWHLHEVVISHIRQVGEDLQRHHVETLAHQGWYNLLEHLLRTTAQLFIQKLRFDPRHSASAEQILFNKLPNWINIACQGREQELALEGQRISISADDLLEPLRSFLSPLSQRLQQAEQDNSLQQLVFSDRFAPIAPLFKRFSKHEVVDAHHLAHSFDDLSQQLQQHPDGVHYLMQLPAKKAREAVEDKNTAEPMADSASPHLLCQSHAYPLHKTLYWTASKQHHGLQVNTPKPQAPYFAQFSGGKITPGNQGHLTINGQAVIKPTQLLAGDQISCDQLQHRLQLVHVHTGFSDALSKTESHQMGEIH